ncbi:MAG: tetratricopeptide repeat protein [Candidatus Omnitrophota bacterium]|nr:tetratricopeptide repeat protein [Candidatus Omnitrophota bacterium]
MPDKSSRNNAGRESPDPSMTFSKGVPGKRVSVNRDTRKRVIAICFLVFFVAFLVYANTLRGDFIWDDEYLILNNSQIKTFSHFFNVFKTYVGYGSENINNFYRPVQEISNMIDFFLWGEYPFGFHLTNVVLHSLVAVMIFLFLFYLSGNTMTAGIAALFWAVHPVHTEAVAYIAGRADSLYSLFMLLSLVSFIRFAYRARAGTDAPAMYVLSVVFFVVSLLAKEIIISMPVLIFLYMFFFLRGAGFDDVYRKLRWYWVPYAVIVVVYGILRLTVLSFADIAPASVFFKIPLPYRLLTFFKTIGVYIRLLFFPVGLHMERSIPIAKSLMPPSALMALFFILATAFIGFYMYRRNRLVSFAIVWFFASLLPVSNIFPINSFLAEHWIYMASIGPFFLVGMGLVHIYNKILPKDLIYRGLFLLIVAAVLVVYGRMSVFRNRDWANEISFFHSTLKYHPRNARLYLNLGNTYYEGGQIDKAIEQYRKSIDINKNYAVAYGNIGSAYLHKGQIDKAEEYLKTAISIKDNYPIAHYNLGIINYKRKRYKPALKELTKATEQLPQLYQAWNMMGRTYLRIGKVSEAKQSFERSLYIRPNQDAIQRALGKMK